MAKGCINQLDLREFGLFKIDPQAGDEHDCYACGHCNGGRLWNFKRRR